MTTTAPPQASEKGTYLIHVSLRQQEVLRVGRRTFVLLPGHYLYVGSAQKGLLHRVRRHLSIDKRRKWDIDSLLSGRARLITAQAWGAHSPSGTECRWAATIFSVEGAFPVLGTKDSSSRIVHGFGAGDCEHRCGCTTASPNLSSTHLIRVSWKPTLPRMRNLLGTELKDLRKEYDL